MLQTSHAIVLNVIRYNDESFIANVLTETDGYVSFLVRRAKSGRSKVQHALFQPLQQIEISWERKTGGGLSHPKQVHAAFNYSDLPFDPAKRAIALYLAEFLSHALRNEPAQPLLFEYVATALQLLDHSRSGVQNFHLTFLLHLTRFLGFLPDDSTYSMTARFDMQNGVFSTSTPTHNHFLSPQDSEFIPQLLRMSPKNMHLYKFTRAQRRQILDIINQYYRLHLPNFPELKSLEVLNAVFDAAQ